MAMARLVGTIAYWNDSRGYGFIKPDDGGADLFFHYRDAPRVELREGVRVDFLVGPGRDGRTRAADLRPINREAA